MNVDLLKGAITQDGAARGNDGRDFMEAAAGAAGKSTHSDPERCKRTYRAQIIEMVKKTEDLLLLRQIYTIMIRRMRKTEV